MQVWRVKFHLKYNPSEQIAKILANDAINAMKTARLRFGSNIIITQVDEWFD